MDFSILLTKEYIALISVVIGAILGFLLSFLKDWIIEGRKQMEKKVDLRRERLEELYVGFSKWSTHIISEQITLLSVMENKITFNDYLDLKIEKTIKFDAQKNEMILEVYADNLLKAHGDVRKQLVYLNQIKDDFEKLYSKQGPHIASREFLEGNKLFTVKFEEKSDIFKEQLAYEIRQVI